MTVGAWLDGTGARQARWLFLLTWAAAIAYALRLLDAGWFPADTGGLGQAAERVLAGELPHRDFADTYTGGLAFLDAWAFRLLGVSVMSMRWAVFTAYALWIPAVWYIGRRVAGPLTAAVATLLAASWTLPVYAEGMPSWYNLFLATFGAAALLRYLDDPRSRWLIVAGLAGGLSVLFKVVGFYFLAAAVVFLVHVEATEDAADGNAGGAGPDRRPGQAQRGGPVDVGYRLGLALALMGLAGAIAWLVGRGMGWRHLFLYGMPPLAALVPALVVASRPTGRTSGNRLRGMAGLCLPLVLGAAAPIALFLLPFALGGGLGDLAAGVFAMPQERLDSVRMIGPAGRWYFAMPASATVLWLMRPIGPGSRGGRIAVGAGVFIAVTMLATSHQDLSYVLVFRSLLWLGPLVCAVAAVVVSLRGLSGLGLEATLLLSVFGLTSLVQVPFAAPVYFFYAAPLLVLLSAALAGPEISARRGWTVGTMLTLLVFTVLRLNTGFTPDLGFRFRPDESSRPLVLQRAMGLRVSAQDKADYEALVELIEALEPGPVIFAGPDSPEVYFLTGRANPTTTLYEVLEDGEGRDRRVLATVDQQDVRVIVVRVAPLFSDPFGPELIGELERRFPNGRQVGRFLVAWRDGAGS